MFVVILSILYITGIWFQIPGFEIRAVLFFSIGAYLAYRANSKRWFNIAVLVAVLRILGHYADVDNLQFFGIYLIGSGLLLLVTLLLLKKYGKLLWENRDEK